MLMGIENDLKTQANQHDLNHFNTHWGELTKGLDMNNNAAVDAFANNLGVTRGRVGMTINGQGEYHPMTNAELMAVTKQQYRNGDKYQTLLSQDPTHQANLQRINDATMGRRLGVNPYDLRQMEAATQSAQNQADAVRSDAAARALAAKGLYREALGRAGVSDATASKLIPSQAAINNANVSLTIPAQANDLASQTAARNMLTHITGGQWDIDSKSRDALNAANLNQITANTAQTNAQAGAIGVLAPSEAARNYAVANAPQIITGPDGNPVAVQRNVTYSPPSSQSPAPWNPNQPIGPTQTGTPLGASPALVQQPTITQVPVNPTTNTPPPATPGIPLTEKAPYVWEQDKNDPNTGFATDRRTGIRTRYIKDPSGRFGFIDPQTGTVLNAQQGASTAQPVDEQGLFGKSWDAAKEAAKASSPLLGGSWWNLANPGIPIAPSFNAIRGAYRGWTGSPSPNATMSQTPQVSLPRAPQSDAKLDPQTALIFLNAAGRDPERARQLANQYGWSF